MQANTICKSQKRFMLSLKLDQISGSIPVFLIEESFFILPRIRIK